jgi:hypothetical protein
VWALRRLSGVCAPSALHPCAGKQTLAAVSTTWKWQTKAETAGTTVNTDELAIAVLQLGATPPTRRRYMALAG